MSVTLASMVPGGQTGKHQALTCFPMSCRCESEQEPHVHRAGEAPRRGEDRVAAGEYFSEDKMCRKIPERVFWLNFSQHQDGPQVQPVLHAGLLTEDSSLSGRLGT